MSPDVFCCRDCVASAALEAGVNLYNDVARSGIRLDDLFAVAYNSLIYFYLDDKIKYIIISRPTFYVSTPRYYFFYTYTTD